MLSSLNPQQKQAAKIVDGPVMIVAGPGSGKTRVLVSRIVYLISQGINPKNILAVTFTNKAAQEMKERIISFLKENKNGFIFNSQREALPNIGTFHSICLRILRREAKNIGLAPSFVIYDDRDSLALIKKILQENQISEDYIKSNRVIGTISKLKNELVSPDEYRANADGYYQEKVADIFLQYQSELEKLSALDFDDLIGRTVKLFQDHPDILSKYQNLFQYILVDEWQDTNHAQYTLIKLLAGKNQNVFVIGDLDQSIYGWRGADFRNVLEFEKDFPQTKTILMEQNYRSTQVILSAAQAVIEKNSQRKAKGFWTEKQGGELILFHQAEDEKNEGLFIANEIQKLTAKSYSYSDIVILYRTNAQSRAIEEAFLKRGLRYRVIGTTKFYHRQEVKDILAYLRLIINPNDQLSQDRIINVPPRKIGRQTLEKIKKQNVNPNSLPAVKKFFDLMEDLRSESGEMPLTKLINYIITQTNYDNYLANISDRGEEKLENIKELLTVAKKYDHLPPPDGIQSFLEEVALLSDQDDLDRNSQAVNLMTLHCAKGLEFPVVFIAGFEESIIPHGRSLTSPMEMEEERRLCYVGMTRAKERLCLTSSRLRHLFGGISANPVSRFLRDIPEELVKWVE